jgi:lipopolysaccharide transport system permease protein
VIGPGIRTLDDIEMAGSPGVHPELNMTQAITAKPLLKIRPPRGWASLSLSDLWSYRDLLITFAERDIKVRYKQTALGAIWVVLQPLIGSLIFAFVFGRIAKMSSDGFPYIVLAYSGLLGWNAFNTTLTRASTSIVDGSRLVSKIYFPRLVLPLSTVGSTLVDFVVSLAFMIVLMLIYHVHPGWQLVFLPVFLLLLLMAAIGIGLFTSALMVSYRDLQYALPPFLQFLLYASPVGYAVSQVPKSLRTLYFLNPLAGLLEGFRWSILGTSQPQLWAVLYAAGVVIAMLFVGLVSFKRMERRFADVI